MSELKNEVDNIVSTLKEADQTLYDPLPNGQSVPIFNPTIPLTAPFKSELFQLLLPLIIISLIRLLT